MNQITRELITALAAAQGLQIADDRVELVRREYLSFVELVDAIEKLPLPREAEPRRSDQQ